VLAEAGNQPQTVLSPKAAKSSAERIGASTDFELRRED
jgi:hypothetical protein